MIAICEVGVAKRICADFKARSTFGAGFVEVKRITRHADQSNMLICLTAFAPILASPFESRLQIENDFYPDIEILIAPSPIDYVLAYDFEVTVP